MLDVSAAACTNGVWPLLWPVSVAQNKPSTMSSSTIQSIYPPRATRPDGSGRWDNRMAAQHLPRYLGMLAVDKRTRSNDRRRRTKENNVFALCRKQPYVNFFKDSPYILLETCKQPFTTRQEILLAHLALKTAFTKNIWAEVFES